MAAYNKFHDFVEQLGKGVHQLHSHILKVYLSNNTPSASAHAIKADLAEIAAGNGYTEGGQSVLNAYSETDGTGFLTGTDIVWTASGGNIATFRYAVLYNDTPSSPADPLIAWWDYGSSISPATGETFTVDFGATIFTIA